MITQHKVSRGGGKMEFMPTSRFGPNGASEGNHVIFSVCCYIRFKVLFILTKIIGKKFSSMLKSAFKYNAKQEFYQSFSPDRFLLHAFKLLATLYCITFLIPPILDPMSKGKASSNIFTFIPAKLCFKLYIYP